MSRRAPRPAGTKRHKWVKVRLHVYICQKCGCGSVNAQDSRGGWFTTYHKPDGTSAIERHVPPCEVGPLSTTYLTKYASAIACAVPSAPLPEPASAGAV